MSKLRAPAHTRALRAHIAARTRHRLRAEDRENDASILFNISSANEVENFIRESFVGPLGQTLLPTPDDVFCARYVGAVVNQAQRDTDDIYTLLELRFAGYHDAYKRSLAVVEQEAATQARSG